MSQTASFNNACLAFGSAFTACRPHLSPVSIQGLRPLKDAAPEWRHSQCLHSQPQRLHSLPEVSGLQEATPIHTSGGESCLFKFHCDWLLDWAVQAAQKHPFSQRRDEGRRLACPSKLPSIGVPRSASCLAAPRPVPAAAPLLRAGPPEGGGGRRTHHWLIFAFSMEYFSRSNNVHQLI